MSLSEANRNEPTEVDVLGAIRVSGDGIHDGKTGQICGFVIKNCKGGTGLLRVQVDGPSHVILDAHELKQGYKVRYTALAPGTYYVAIKYSGAHVLGSPFMVIMAGKKFGGGEPDTSFIEANIWLFVDVLTSKGPCEEVTKRHLGNGQYVVTYRIQEKVKGSIFIKYGDTNIPGSPFAIAP